MKTFLILLAISFGNSEKLDLKYLPPPGSDLAVSSPGDIDMQFRLPLAYSTTVPQDFTEMTSLTSLIYGESKIGFGPDTKVNEKNPLELTDKSMSIRDEGDNTKFQSNNNRPQILTDNSSKKDFILQSTGIHPEELFNPHSNTDDVLFSGIFDQNDSKKLTQNQESNMDLIHPSLTLGKNHKSSIHKSDSDEENLNSEFDNKGFIQNYQANELWTKANYTFTPIKKLFENTMSNFLKTELNPEGRTFPKLILPPKHNQTNSKNIIKSSHSRPQAEFDRNALILNYKNIIKPHGFTYTFNTSNGIHVKENGTATNGVNVQGSYSYTGDDGKFYSVTYTADENGFQPRGEHLPTSPPIPEAILKVIEQAAKNKEAGIFDDGSYKENKYGYKRYQNTSNDKKKSHNEDTLIINGADIPYTEFNSNSVESNEIIPDNDAEVQNKLDTQYSQENEVNFNLTRSNIKAITNKTKIGVAEKNLVEDKVTFPEESFEHELSTDAKKLSPSQTMQNSVTKKVLSNENIHHAKNEKKTAEDMINKISLPRNGNDIIVTTTSETLTNEGYLYIKPQRKFDVFENRFLESDNFILDRKKYDKTSKTKDSEPQPFITPNVSRDYEGSEEDYTDDNID